MCCFAVLGVLSSFAIILFGCFTFVVFLFHVTVSMLCLFHSVVGWFADSDCGNIYCKFGDFREGFIFVKMKSSNNGEITLSFTGIGKSCPSREFLTLQVFFKRCLRK